MADALDDFAAGARALFADPHARPGTLRPQAGGSHTVRCLLSRPDEAGQVADQAYQHRGWRLDLWGEDLPAVHTSPTDGDEVDVDGTTYRTLAVVHETLDGWRTLDVQPV